MVYFSPHGVKTSSRANVSQLESSEVNIVTPEIIGPTDSSRLSGFTDWKESV